MQQKISDKKSLEYFCPITTAGCRGSKCAAWVWAHDNEPASNFPQLPKIIESKEFGYCGMVSK